MSADVVNRKGEGILPVRIVHDEWEKIQTENESDSEPVAVEVAPKPKPIQEPVPRAVEPVRSKTELEIAAEKYAGASLAYKALVSQLDRLIEVEQIKKAERDVAFTELQKLVAAMTAEAKDGCEDVGI
jgi:hypothetical protein